MHENDNASIGAVLSQISLLREDWRSTSLVAEPSFIRTAVSHLDGESSCNAHGMSTYYVEFCVKSCRSNTLPA